MGSVIDYNAACEEVETSQQTQTIQESQLTTASIEQPHVIPEENLIPENILQDHEAMMTILSALQINDEGRRQCSLNTEIAGLYYIHFAEQTDDNDQLFTEMLLQASEMLQIQILPEWNLRQVVYRLRQNMNAMERKYQNTDGEEVIETDIAMPSSLKKSVESFVENASQIHENKYDYSNITIEQPQKGSGEGVLQCGILETTPKEYPSGGIGIDYAKLRDVCAFKQHVDDAQECSEWKHVHQFLATQSNANEANISEKDTC